MLEHAKVFGAHLMYCKHRKQLAEVRVEKQEMLKLVMQPTRAAVHFTENDGTPVLLSADFGDGKIWLCTLPIESTLAEHTDMPEEPN